MIISEQSFIEELENATDEELRERAQIFCLRTTKVPKAGYSKNKRKNMIKNMIKTRRNQTKASPTLLRPASALSNHTSEDVPQYNAVEISIQASHGEFDDSILAEADPQL